MKKVLSLHSQLFFDPENDLLCITRDCKNFNFISPKWETLLGWNLSEIDEKDFKDVIHPEDLQKTIDILEKVCRKERVFGFENRLLTRNKDIVWLEWRLFYENEQDPTFICLAKDITEFKEKDRQLKLSQKHASLGTWKFNALTEKFAVSDEVYRIFDTDPGTEFNYANTVGFYDEANWQKINYAFVNCLQKGTPWNIEIALITKEGNHKWIQSWGFPVMIGDEIVGAEGLIQELTEKKHEELKLKQTVEELDKFQLSINQHSLVARLNPQGYFMDINKGFEKVSNFRLGEILGKHLSELVAQPSPSKIFEILARLNRGQKWRGELRLRGKDRSYFWIDMSLTPIMDMSHNQLYEIIAISYDITEKKLNDERYHTVLSGINAGIWDWPDLAREEIYWSPRLYDILEYDPSKTHPSNLFHEIIHPDDKEWVNEKLKRAITTDDNFLLEFRVMSGKGGFFWIQCLGIILKDEESKPYRMIGSIIDINQKKLIEFNLAEEKQKTIQASKLATLGEMAAGLAHEVNNPLTIIFGYIRILEEELLSDEINYESMHKHVGLIKNAAQRAAKIVTNLKDFARDGSADPFTDLHASELVAMVLDLCFERFKKSGIRIDVALSEDPLISCRKIEMSQVLLNLLFNSFDALEELPEKWVRISAKSLEKTVELSVIDSGQGIPEEIAEKLFTPFFTTKKVGLGTGIGLSISQRIVLNHGGEIFYDSASPNTRFVVRLPYLREVK